MLLGTCPAAAAENVRIVLVGEAGAPSRGLARLRAELDALGLEVVEMELDPENRSPTALDDLARKVGAFAAVRLVPSVNGAEVWVADRITGKTVLREVVVGRHQTADDIVALRAVELLRVSLLELRMPRAEPQPEVAARVQELVPATEPATYPFEATVGPAVSTSPGGLTAALQGFLALRYNLPELLAIEAFAMLPTFSTRIGTDQGQADVSIGMAGLGLQLRLSERTIRTRVGAGAAAVLLRMNGSPNPPYQGRSDSIVSGAPFVSFGLARDLGPSLALGAEVIAGAAVPRPVIEFAGGQVATWGRPFACAALTLDLRVR